jgi:hypothetical protein
MLTKNLGLTVTITAILAAFVVGPGLRADTEPMPVDIVVAPNVVYLASQGTWVTVHAEISYYAVSGASVSLNGIPVKVTFADSRGELVAKFSLDAVKDIIGPPTAELTLRGETKSGVSFQGSDTIRVFAPKQR